MALQDKIEQTQKGVVNRLHGDRVIWSIVFLLSLVSIALIYSASSSLAFRDHTTNFAIMLRQLKFIVMGWVFLFICYKIPVGWYRRFAHFALLASIALLVITMLFGRSANDAVRWINIGGFKFQPSEFAKIGLVIYLARALEISTLDSFKEYLFRILAPVAIVCVLLMMGSISSGLFMGLVSLAILIISGIKSSYIWKSIGIGAIGLVLIFLLNLAFHLFPRMDTAVNRIKLFTAKEEVVNTAELSEIEKARQADKTLQADMARIAVESGGFLGKGPGKSTQRNVLPHPYSDFIYAIITEEYGVWGGVVVMFLYIWLMNRCVRLVKDCKTIFSAIVVGGLGLSILLQAFLHIFVNIGILPVTGHTLPLVSLGGTSFIAICCAFGIILSVSRTKDSQDKEAVLASTEGEANDTAGASAATDSLSFEPAAESVETQ